MARYQIVLADRDEEYLSLLELRFLEHFGNVADIQLISDPIYFHEFFARPQRIDMLVLNEELYTPELARHSIGVVIRLSETPVERGGAVPAGAESLRVYKYTSMKELFAVLATFLHRDEQEEGAARARLICVYSPAGGAGTTTVALGLAGALANARRRVFYLDTETLQSARLLLPEAEGPSPAFCSALISGEPGLAELLPGACGRGSFDYLKPFPHSTTACGVELEHFRRLAEDLRESGRYDFVLLDCSSDFTREKSALMAACDRVVVVTGQSRTACWKTEALLQDINIRDNRFLFVCNQYQKEEPSALRDTLLGRISIAEYIPRYPDELCASLDELAREEAVARLALQLL